MRKLNNKNGKTKKSLVGLTPGLVKETRMLQALSELKDKVLKVKHFLLLMLLSQKYQFPILKLFTTPVIVAKLVLLAWLVAIIVVEISVKC
jgi:hypothetical protein